MDYVLQPEPHNISLVQENVQLQVYSLAEQSIRSVNVPLDGKSLGLVVRHEPLNECILKVVNVLKGSPMERHDIRPNEDYIIGMKEHPYTSLKAFMGVLKQLIEAEHGLVQLGVLNSRTRMRMVRIEVKELLQWRAKGKGILGCELAEGWANRIRPTGLPQKKGLPTSPAIEAPAQNDKA